MNRMKNKVIVFSLLLAAPLPALPEGQLNIALTNDDGWQAHGIQAVHRALTEAGHQATMAAPSDQQSGSSAAMDSDSIEVRRVAETQYSVTACKDDACDARAGAEPITAALVAVDLARRSGDDSWPDLLVSGINEGTNIGVATQLSGTVGATVASLSHVMNSAVPSIAISTDEPAHCEDNESCVIAHYDDVANFIVRLVEVLNERRAASESLLPAGIGLNINYPSASPRGVRVVRQESKMDIGGSVMVFEVGCEKCPGLEIGEIAAATNLSFSPDSAAEPGGEISSFNEGYVTIVPIRIDYTASDYQALSDWFDGMHWESQ